MNKMKAVVLEKTGSSYTVLDQNGTFRQVHRRLNAEVGDEIHLQPLAEYFSGVRIWAGAVALFLLVFTTILGWNLYQAPTAVALLSVDINPSLQLALDKQGHLLKIETQDEDAKRMLSQLVLKGKPIEEVLKQIVTQAYAQKFLSSEQYWVVIGYSPMTNKTIEQMPKALNENQIRLWVSEIGEKKGLTPQVAVFSLTSQERELAQKGNLTLGEYALWQTAHKAGVVTQPEKLKDNSERVRLLENPEVQAQIKSENQGVESNLPRTPGASTQNPGVIAKPPSSPVKAPNNPVIEKDKEQSKDKTMEKDKGKDPGQAYTKDSGEPKTGGVNQHDNGYVPVLAPIPTPENSKHDAYHAYKIPERPERSEEGKKSDLSSRKNNDDSK